MFEPCSVNLPAIPKPSACSLISPVFNFGIYEKSLCYVRAKATYNKAQSLCTKLGMQLYKIDTGASTAIIFNFVKQYFGASSKAVAYVDGNNGKECLTYSGTGKKNYDRCQTSYTFFCEFNHTSKFSEKSFKKLGWISK
jgi:hypothetical protein